MIIVPEIINGNAIIMISQLALYKPPSNQKNRKRNCWLVIYIKNDIIAVKKDPIAIPVSNRVSTLTFPSLLAIWYTANTVEIAPMNAKIGVV